MAPATCRMTRKEVNDEIDHIYYTGAKMRAHFLRCVRRVGHHSILPGQPPIYLTHRLGVMGLGALFFPSTPPAPPYDLLRAPRSYPAMNQQGVCGPKHIAAHALSRTESGSAHAEPFEIADCRTSCRNACAKVKSSRSSTSTTTWHRQMPRNRVGQRSFIIVGPGAFAVPHVQTFALQYRQVPSGSPHH